MPASWFALLRTCWVEGLTDQPAGKEPRVTYMEPVVKVARGFTTTSAVDGPLTVLHVSATEVVVVCSKLTACILPAPIASPSIATMVILEC